MGGVLVVVEPPPFEVSSAVPVAVVDVVEPALVLLVLLVVAVPAAAALPSAPPSAPQPASAMARLPIKQATRRRPDANPGSPVLSLACIFATPDKQLHTG
jgi:hypothetical protein